MNWMKYALVISIAIAVCTPTAICGEGKTWEDTITLPTYPWQPADINPVFYAVDGSENNIIYPYSMEDHISSAKVNRQYKTVNLENEYLKVICIPELGGRIFSVLDKTTGEEMFHRNNVVKPGLISMRGAWISGGIEWNTGPHGHTVTAISPVNVASVKAEDGSVSLIVTNTEMIFRTRWQVILTLQPGKSYLDEKISIFNPLDGVHPYYFWNCTAFICTPQTRFIYPMTLGCDHAGTSFFTWPMFKGKDISWLKNYDTPTSVFAHDCAFDFFGSYDAGLDRGIVQYANHDILIGKKAWTWGQSADGIVREGNLHEGKEQYIEVQSGPLLTQADYGLLHPRETVSWQEWWYPIHGFGDGFEYATRDAAVQHFIKDGKLEFRVITTGRFPEATCRFLQDGKNVEQKVLNLSPSKPEIFILPCSAEKPVNVQIVDREGAVLLDYQSPLDIPKVNPPKPDWLTTKKEKELTAEETYLKGLLFDKQTNRTSARKWYEKALVLDPQHIPSLKGLAVLDLESGLLDDAIKRLNDVMARSKDDGMAAYYLGSAWFQKGEYPAAQTWGYKAIRTLSRIALGNDLIGRSLMCQGKYTEAVEVFRQSVANNPQDTRAKDHLLLALYKSGEQNKAQELLTEMMKDDPTGFIPLMVDRFLNPWKAGHYVESIPKELGEIDFEIEEVALVFYECGLVDEAYTIFTDFYAAPNTLKSNSPMPDYYMAFLADRLGKKELVSSYLAKAQSLPSDYVFPSRPETIKVLQFAIESKANSGKGLGKTHLYLGNLYGGLGRMQEAKTHWEMAVKLDESQSVAWRNLGLLAWKEDKNLAEAASDYRHAIAARPEDQPLYRDLSQILIADQKRHDAISLLNPLLEKKNLRQDILEIIAQAYLDEKEYDRVINILSQSFFSNWEGRNMSRNIFVAAHMARGKSFMESANYKGALEDFSASLTYPEFLGVGRPADAEEAEILYLKAKALSALGRKAESIDVWKQAAASREGSENQNKYRKLSAEELQKQ